VYDVKLKFLFEEDSSTNYDPFLLLPQTYHYS